MLAIAMILRDVSLQQTVGLRFHAREVRYA